MSEYKLSLSRDAGTTYNVVEESDTLRLLDSFCQDFDKKGWRWVIEDSNGEIIRYCAIHHTMLNTLKNTSSINKASLEVKDD